MVDTQASLNGSIPRQPGVSDAKGWTLNRAAPLSADEVQKQENIKALRSLKARNWAKEQVELSKAKARPKMWDTILSADDLDELPEVLPLIEGVIPQNSYGILNGRDSTYKSFEALDMALCMVTGKDWHGHAVTMPEDRPCVLYIAAEGAHGLVPRIRSWEQENGLKVSEARNRPPVGSPNYRDNPEGTPRFYLKFTAANLFMGPDSEELVNIVERHLKIGCVIIDTLRRSSGGAEQNGSDMGVVIDNISKIKEATDGGTVLVLAHTNKDDADTRGSSLIEDDADFVWHSQVKRGVVVMTNKKMKDGAVHEDIKFNTKAVGKSLVLEPLDPFEDPEGGADKGTEALILEAVRLIDRSGQDPTRAEILRTAKDLVPAGDAVPSASTLIRALGACLTAGTLVQERKKGPYTLPE